ncbi:hypothetical protein U9M48_032017 [Paspalum notatum var. saurae]|uniref:Uncharacterized protein n=1 Tax=Paspalum notatum var. saurae TaxID=547442 RepID=A0AAQ3U7Z7_PASNO
MVQKNNGKNKGRNMTTNFKRKMMNRTNLPCFTWGELGHFYKDCLNHPGHRRKKSSNGQSSKMSIQLMLAMLEMLGVNVHHVPDMNKILVSGSLLCTYEFKVVHCLFIGKGYDCGGLFHLSLLDFSNKYVKHICGGVHEDAIN